MERAEKRIMEKSTQVTLPKKVNSDEALAESLPEEPLEKVGEKLELPVLPIRNAVLIPHMVIPLLVAREPSIQAVENAAKYSSNKMFVVAQTNEELEDPGCEDVYEVGVEGHIDR